MAQRYPKVSRSGKSAHRANYLIIKTYIVKTSFFVVIIIHNINNLSINKYTKVKKGAAATCCNCTAMLQCTRAALSPSPKKHVSSKSSVYFTIARSNREVTKNRGRFHIRSFMMVSGSATIPYVLSWLGEFASRVRFINHEKSF